MTAADRWRTQLEARAIPAAILESAPEPPWGFPTELFRGRAERASRTEARTPTTVRALEALPEGGSVLDVGVGGGATSLPLAARAARIIGVDAQADMLEVFAAAARAAGAEPSAVAGTWPEVAALVPEADVAVCGHVLYNVADLPPFVRGLEGGARRRVVVELTQTHPLAWANDLWERFHGIVFPSGPTVDDALAVLVDLGIAPGVDTRLEGDEHAGGFERREDAVHLIRRRLCLPADRDAEIEAALGDRLGEHGGRWSAGPIEQEVFTLWWDTHR